MSGQSRRATRRVGALPATSTGSIAAFRSAPAARPTVAAIPTTGDAPPSGAPTATIRSAPRLQWPSESGASVFFAVERRPAALLQGVDVEAGEGGGPAFHFFGAVALEAEPDRYVQGLSGQHLERVRLQAVAGTVGRVTRADQSEGIGQCRRAPAFDGDRIVGLLGRGQTELRVAVTSGGAGQSARFNAILGSNKVHRRVQAEPRLARQRLRLR